MFKISDKINIPLVNALMVILIFASCFKLIHEPDIFWQIKTGSYILAHHTIPVKDVFSMTFSGFPWFNIKWLSEVLMALLVKGFGLPVLAIWQALILLAIIVFLKKTWEVLTDKKLATLIWFIPFILAVNNRMNTRPELYSYLFTTLFVYLNVLFCKKDSKWVYALIPLQCLWANMHDAFPVGIVINSLVLFSLYRGKGQKQLRVYLPVFLLSVVSTVLNPHFFAIWPNMLKTYRQLGADTFTTEMSSIQHSAFLTIFSFLTLVLIFIAFLHLVKKENRRQYPLWLLLLFPAFAFLFFKAERNNVFVLIAISPFLITWLKNHLPTVNKLFSLIPLLFVYGIFASGMLYKIAGNHDHYGLGLDYDKVPLGAVHFIKKNNIHGKAFTDYFSSSYLLYALDNDYKTYIDLRDFEVFNRQIFKNVFMCYQHPQLQAQKGVNLWNYFNEGDDFNYIVLENGKADRNLNRYIFNNDKRYQLVYADPISSVYIRNDKANSGIVDKYAYENRKQHVFNKTYTNEKNAAFYWLAKILNPWYRKKRYNLQYSRKKALYFSGLSQ